jgi:hypothetical protein
VEEALFVAEEVEWYSFVLPDEASGFSGRARPGNWRGSWRERM